MNHAELMKSIAKAANRLPEPGLMNGVLFFIEQEARKGNCEMTLLAQSSVNSKKTAKRLEQMGFQVIYERGKDMHISWY